MYKLKVNAPLLIILSGVIFSLYLLSQIPDEIYYSGDGGLKALLAKQISSGKLQFNLDLPAPQWVHDLWNHGLYPFEAPFSYKISNLYYITFPFTFPLVTAPFYALFGFRGFYIIPLISTWFIWLSFYRLCQFYKLDQLITAIGLLTLIFASPLTMYSAMYWEHTLAVCLAFNGLQIMLTKGAKDFSTKNSVFSGILIGLSVWFRPEFLALVAIVIMLVITSYGNSIGLMNGILKPNRRDAEEDKKGVFTSYLGSLYIIQLDLITIIKSKQIIFLTSLILTVLCFFALNKLIYNHPLGAHAFQVVENFSLQARLLKSVKFFNELKNDLPAYFPIIYFAIPVLVISLFRKNINFTPAIKQILLISILFLCLVPVLIPSDGGKQWGSRFLLILIPLLNFIAISCLDRTWKIKKFGIRYISSGIFVTLFILGFHLNTIQGTINCYQKGKMENLAVLNFLRKDSNKIVAVANQYVGQSFETTFKQKTFFLTKQPDDVSKLGLALHEQSYEKFIYICPVYDKCFSSPQIPDKLELSANNKNLTIQLKKIIQNNRYRIEEAAIIENQQKA
ncbi:hypothetical protein H6G54_19650 [Anabaena cylindrica FACHB-243]|uniref:Dolichol-phosphate mannosyltransferase n=1 Tax=Anabaena cylindrica (strain ATCC 27899 / PCC 7122) TaxID=272123 RepID=K9ZI66_ANACC|nr:MULTISPECIES: hypothetical protein [Anabaena]AFZ58232.1 hypothetical protein Anacy_2799 [Anabaena cylindrica PCC 7122]MBD2419880.1 hypothetical protein [Anabaena cylindrica FACHB-243]MBY5281006.1 hypothetical protein [Anabaena sp. CCAP 1446/1C]MBY5307343.1 hypothetical protein [Anabaena sp. CCAP 1446/1C]MCM2407919.1 hypothetical protein [Anabaena sp. CCAP 1446/1C]